MHYDYEPITKGVKEYLTRLVMSDQTKGELRALCDGIDAIHYSLEKENERLRDVSKRGDDWIKLPIDADGVPVRVGDAVEWRDHSGKWYEQTRVVAITDDGCYLYDSGLFHVNRSDLRHHKPDTWENIIEDALGSRWAAPDELSQDFINLVERCKALCERTREGEE